MRNSQHLSTLLVQRNNQNYTTQILEWFLNQLKPMSQKQANTDFSNFSWTMCMVNTFNKSIIFLLDTLHFLNFKIWNSLRVIIFLLISENDIKIKIIVRIDKIISEEQPLSLPLYKFLYCFTIQATFNSEYVEIAIHRWVFFS